MKRKKTLTLDEEIDIIIAVIMESKKRTGDIKHSKRPRKDYPARPGEPSERVCKICRINQPIENFALEKVSQTNDDGEIIKTSLVRRRVCKSCRVNKSDRIETEMKRDDYTHFLNSL